jgi:hypothetical protein
MLKFITQPKFTEFTQMNARAMREGFLWKSIAQRYEQQVYIPIIQKKVVRL